MSVTLRSYNDITGETLHTNSLMRAFPVIKDNLTNESCMNIFRSLLVDEIDPVYFLSHEVDYSEWWDTISYKYYQTAQLWWLTPEINKIENPFEAPEEGTIIKVLLKDYIYNYLSEYVKLGVV
jgi:hypothetical protein